jgi:hypothetical protein
MEELNLVDSLAGALQGVSDTVLLFVPKILIALIILIIGWVAGVIVGRFVSQIISALKVDKAMERLGVDRVVTRAGFHLNTGNFVGKIVEWFVIVVFLVGAFDVLGLPQVNQFLQGTILAYLPNVIVAAVILVIAALISDGVSKLVTGSAKAAHLPSAHLLGGFSKWAIWIFAIVAALDHLGIAQELLLVFFQGLIYMLAIAGGLAFGIGGKDAAARFIERLRGDISER